MSQRLRVLYDEDCGFCRWSADRLRAWDRSGRLAFASIQTSVDLLGPVPAAERLDAMHAVEPDGRVWTGGAALTRIARELPGALPFAWLGTRAPGAAERGYRWLAVRRDRFGAIVGTQACLVDSVPAEVNAHDVLAELRRVADPSRLAGMARVGIDVDRALGVSVPNIRRVAKRAGHDQVLARELWATGIHEARIAAALIAEPSAFTLREMTTWAADLDSWDVCDMLAGTFAVSLQADRAIERWSRARHGFTKRCAFSMMATIAVHDAGRPDEDFVRWLPLIRAASADDRNEVKKAVNWALRQIGKRNLALRAAAIDEAKAIAATGTPPGRWIARDALRELRDPRIVARIRR